jgi:glucose-6-phosphate 1-dehydrogenase
MGRTVEIPVVHMEFGSFIMVAKELTQRKTVRRHGPCRTIVEKPFGSAGPS